MEQDKLETILNYYPINERIASSGQPTAEQFELIAENGYKVLVNLAMSDSPQANSEEDLLVSTKGIVYIHILVPFDSPHADHLQYFLHIMNAFKDKKIWVHCIFNFRGSTFLYHYLKKIEGYSEKDARAAIFTSWKPDPVWENFFQVETKDTFL